MSDILKIVDFYETTIIEVTVENLSDYEVSDGKSINNWKDVRRVVKWYEGETDGECYLYVIDSNGNMFDAYTKVKMCNVFEWIKSVN